MGKTTIAWPGHSFQIHNTNTTLKACEPRNQQSASTKGTSPGRSIGFRWVMAVAELTMVYGGYNELVFMGFINQRITEGTIQYWILIKSSLNHH